MAVTKRYAFAMGKPVLRFRSRRLEQGRTLPDGRRVRAGSVVHECWLEDEITDGWMVAYRVLPQKGRPVVGEVRIHPGSPGSDFDAGEWSAEWEGFKAEVPEGGIRAKLLTKQLRFGRYLSEVAEIVRPMEQKWGRSALYDRGQLLSRHGFTPEVAERETPVGRPSQYSLLDLARFARDLNRIIRHGNPKAPVKELAEVLGVEHEKMSRQINRAREKGMLDKPEPGLSGGRLTERARALLRDAGEEEE